MLVLLFLVLPRCCRRGSGWHTVLCGKLLALLAQAHAHFGHFVVTLVLVPLSSLLLCRVRSRITCVGAHKILGGKWIRGGPHELSSEWVG